MLVGATLILLTDVIPTELDPKKVFLISFLKLELNTRYNQGFIALLKIQDPQVQKNTTTG